MRIRIVSKTEDYDLLKKMFLEYGIEESESPTHILYDVSLVNKRLTLRTTDNETRFIDVEEILVVESFGNIIELKTKKEIIRTKEKLHSFLEEKSLERLIQINKSQLVLINHIKVIKPLVNSKLQLILDNGEKLYVSRTYKTKFRNKIIEMEE